MTRLSDAEEQERTHGYSSVRAHRYGQPVYNFVTDRDRAILMCIGEWREFLRDWDLTPAIWYPERLNPVIVIYSPRE